jgi:trans-2,3-dihydro-3-hydroxyanthranilate isomerase
MSARTSYRYRVVDVFTERPLEGNALAVFTDASGMDDGTMQKLGRELNLSETTFVLPSTRPGCVARVRIFTPAREMVFAGHPTIGTAFVLRDEGVAAGERFALDEKVGAVPIRVEAGDRPRIWLATPPIHSGPTYDRALCAAALGLEVRDLLEAPPQLLSAGNPTIFIAVTDRATVDRAWLDLQGAKKLKGLEEELACVFVFAPTAGGAYSRMFAPDYGVVEDPATGSSTGPLALFMMRHGLVSSSSGTCFFSEQGTKMQRRSILHVQIHGAGGADGIEVGGHVTPVAEGTMSF